MLLLTLPFNMAQGWTFTVQALDMGLINTVVPLDKLQEETTVLVPRDPEKQPHSSQSAQGSAQCSCESAFYGSLYHVHYVHLPYI